MPSLRFRLRTLMVAALIAGGLLGLGHRWTVRRQLARFHKAEEVKARQPEQQALGTGLKFRFGDGRQSRLYLNHNAGAAAKFRAQAKHQGQLRHDCEEYAE